MVVMAAISVVLTVTVVSAGCLVLIWLSNEGLCMKIPGEIVGENMSNSKETVSDLLTSGVLLVNIAMSGGYPQPVREEALRRFRANVEDLHELKHDILRCKVKAVSKGG